MRRLWIQLSFAFGMVVIISAVLLIIVTSIYGELQRQSFERDILERFPQLATPPQTADEPPIRVFMDAPPPPMPLFRPETIVIILTVIGVIMGIVGGVVMSRRLSAPLSQLADVARKFGGRDFNQRVHLRSGSLELREVASAFNDMASALQQSEQLRNNMIADTAHELRTPLSVMESNLRALIDDVYPLTKTEILHLYDQTRHLSRLVNDLHELSLADAHELPFDKSDVDMVALIGQVADIFMPIAESESIHMTVHAYPQPLYVFGDAGRLSQVLHNLLVNALRYTPENGEITLGINRHHDMVQVTVRDTGIGIAEAHLAHIFERFYRADKSRQRGSGGTGLGLAIGKAIIEAHGGRMTVTSQTTPPSGTIFTIQLPLANSSA